MEKRDEREILLAAATAGEWQKWLNKIIEHPGGPNRLFDPPDDDWDISNPGVCLFCWAYGYGGAGRNLEGGSYYADHCGRCMPNEFQGEPGPCMNLGDRETKIERAKQRLRDAGIWKD